MTTSRCDAPTKASRSVSPARSMRSGGRYATLLFALGLPMLSGCQSDLLPAVFGLGSGGIAAYAPGTLPVIEARPGDRLIGQSGTETGRCIFENRAGNRFRSACPPDFSL